MVCSGINSGLQAVRLGSLLLRTRRTHRAVIVGVEPDDRVAAGVYKNIRAGAACVVLEERSDQSAATLLGPVRISNKEICGVTRPPGVPLSLYGAQGVVELATVVALSQSQSSPWAWTVGSGSPEDGFASVLVKRVHDGERGALDD